MPSHSNDHGRVYDPEILTWNDTHTINDQHRYCYCGEDRSLLEICLQCQQCLNWFHERCIRVTLGPIVPFVTNYRFVCRWCVQSESLGSLSLVSSQNVTKVTKRDEDEGEDVIVEPQGNSSRGSESPQPVAPYLNEPNSEREPSPSATKGVSPAQKDGEPSAEAQNNTPPVADQPLKSSDEETTKVDTPNSEPGKSATTSSTLSSITSPLPSPPDSETLCNNSIPSTTTQPVPVKIINLRATPPVSGDKEGDPPTLVRTISNGSDVSDSISDLSSPELDPSLIDESDEENIPFLSEHHESQPDTINPTEVEPSPLKSTKIPSMEVSSPCQSAQDPTTPEQPVESDPTMPVNSITLQPSSRSPSPVKATPQERHSRKSSPMHIEPSGSNAGDRLDDGTTVEFFERTSAGWKDICATTIANLSIQYLQKIFNQEDFLSARADACPLPECYFNKQEIVPFVDANWKALCTFRSRTTTWWATLGSCLYTVNNVFITRDGRRRTAASDFRLMDVNLWNFRPGAIPPRPNRTQGPSIGGTTNGVSSSEDSSRRKSLAKSHKKKRSLDRSAGLRIDPSSTTLPHTNIIAEEEKLGFPPAKRIQSAPLVRETIGAFPAATATTPGLESVAPPHSARFYTKRAQRVGNPSTPSAVFSTAQPMKKLPPYVDPPVEAINDAGLVYTPCVATKASTDDIPASAPNGYRLAEPAENVWASQALSFQDRNPLVQLTNHGRTATGNAGFRSARGVYPIVSGQWYLEFWINAAEPGEYDPHVRVGLGLAHATLDAPVGTDRYGYGLRDVTGEAVHNGKRHALGEPFRTGDVIGFYISIPKIPEYEEMEYSSYTQTPEDHSKSTPKGTASAAQLVTVAKQPYLRRAELLAPNGGPVLEGAWLARQLPTKPNVPCCSFGELPKRTGGSRGRHSARGGSVNGHTTAGGMAGRTRGVTPHSVPLIPGSKILIFKNGQYLGTPFMPIHSWLPSTASQPLSTSGSISPTGKQSTTSHQRHFSAHDKMGRPNKPIAGSTGGAESDSKDPSRAKLETAPGATPPYHTDMQFLASCNTQRLGYFPMVSVFRGGSVTLNGGPNFKFPPPSDPEVVWETPANGKTGTKSPGPQPGTSSKVDPVWKPYSDLWLEKPVNDFVENVIATVINDQSATT
ncbi:transcription factor, contains a PHD finger motif [Dispira parvispora]|uniref:Transcription factor, contains a PHD finger motif n=1 Tax=Dispira parvispora TaxID=1520584 RepID=A0A9W8E5A8_9FUNG|nr:transcription factor, contains a PHD finger motif [Dispira parvispora]